MLVVGDQQTTRTRRQMTTFDEKDTTFDKTLEKDTTIDKTLILDSFSITYGEETQLPLSIQEADIAFEAVPSQQLVNRRTRLVCTRLVPTQACDPSLFHSHRPPRQ